MGIEIRVLLLMIGAFAAGFYTGMPDSVPMKEYRAVVNEGETVWDACQKVASNKDNLNKVVWETCQRNNIERPGSVQPGTVIIIRVKDTEKNKI